MRVTTFMIAGLSAFAVAQDQGGSGSGSGSGSGTGSGEGQANGAANGGAANGDVSGSASGDLSGQVNGVLGQASQALSNLAPGQTAENTGVAQTATATMVSPFNL